MAEPQIPLPEPPAPPPLTATLAQIAGKPEFSLAEFRKARSNDVPATEPPKAELEKAEPEAKAEPSKEPEQVKEPSTAEVSEAAKTLAQHKSTRAKEIAEEIRLLTKDKHEHRREIEAAKAELVQMRADIAALKGAHAPPKTDAERVADPKDSEPKEEDFEHYRDFTKAQARWEVNQELAAAQDQWRKDAGERAQQTALERVYTTGTEAFPDYEEVLQSALDAGVRWSPFITRVIFSHPQGHRLAYNLAKDHALSQTLSSIRDPMQLGIELAPHLSRLSAAPSGSADVAKPVTKAQDPPKPVGAAPTASLPSLESAVAGTEISLKRIRQINDARRGGR